MATSDRGGYVVSRTRAGFHIMIRGNNAEPIVDGEVLKTRQSARDAILAIGRLHSPQGTAYLLAGDSELRIWWGDREHAVPVVWRDDRAPSRTERVLNAVSRKVTGTPKGVQARIDTGYPGIIRPGESHDA